MHGQRELAIVDRRRGNGLSVNHRCRRRGDIDGRWSLRDDGNGSRLNAGGRAHRAGADRGKYQDCGERTNQDSLP